MSRISYSNIKRRQSRVAASPIFEISNIIVHLSTIIVFNLRSNNTPINFSSSKFANFNEVRALHNTDEYVRSISSKSSSKLSTLAAWSFLSNVSKRREEKTDELAWQVRSKEIQTRRSTAKAMESAALKEWRKPNYNLGQRYLSWFSRNDKTRLNIGNVYWLSRGKKLYLTWNLIDSILVFEWLFLFLFFFRWLKLKTTVCSPRGNIIKSKL